MKKIIQTIKLRRYKTKLNEEALKKIPENRYLVWYKDGTAEEAPFKEDLINILEKDHIRPIRYIFNMEDRIILDRDIKVNVCLEEKK